MVAGVGLALAAAGGGSPLPEGSLRCLTSSLAPKKQKKKRTLVFGRFRCTDYFDPDELAELKETCLTLRILSSPSPLNRAPVSLDDPRQCAKGRWMDDVVVAAREYRSS